MTIQLKRFIYDFSGVNVVQKKVNEVVKFPYLLDMNKYISKKNINTAKNYKNDKDNKDSKDDHIAEGKT